MDSELTAAVYYGHPPFPGVTHFDAPKLLSVHKLNFDIDPSNSAGWRMANEGNRLFGAKELASFLLKFMLDEGEKRAANNP